MRFWRTEGVCVCARVCMRAHLRHGGGSGKAPGSGRHRRPMSSVLVAGRGGEEHVQGTAGGSEHLVRMQWEISQKGKPTKALDAVPRRGGGSTRAVKLLSRWFFGV